MYSISLSEWGIRIFNSVLQTLNSKDVYFERSVRNMLTIGGRGAESQVLSKPFDKNPNKIDGVKNF